MVFVGGFLQFGMVVLSDGRTCCQVVAVVGDLKIVTVLVLVLAMVLVVVLTVELLVVVR